ncbi:MAG TPA: hypothetical protein VIQ31_28875 [Phormidium sp.]
MKKSILSIALFAWLLLLITAPFAAFASLMLFVVGAAFLRTFWSLFAVLIAGDSRESS